MTFAGKNLAVAGVVWVLVVGILVYSLFFTKPAPNPYQVGPS
jgi:hypothetical protein